jgi:hypothetical protein
MRPGVNGSTHADGRRRGAHPLSVGQLPCRLMGSSLPSGVSE